LTFLKRRGGCASAGASTQVTSTNVMRVLNQWRSTNITSTNVMQRFFERRRPLYLSQNSLVKWFLDLWTARFRGRLNRLGRLSCEYEYYASTNIIAGRADWDAEGVRLAQLGLYGLLVDTRMVLGILGVKWSYCGALGLSEGRGQIFNRVGGF
jgi:hypothetical protein